jgi:hypothetical protein
VSIAPTPAPIVPSRTIMISPAIPIMKTISTVMPPVMVMPSDITALQSGRSQKQKRQRGKKRFFHVLSYRHVADRRLRSASFP